ncbi:MAG: protein kinase [Alphaproteobacteria bacterium]|nr:protein kinase [Alphaproteobacteria bacterium]
MFCICCERETQGTPCDNCGGNPLLDGRYCLRSLLGGSRFSRTWSAFLGSDRVAVQELPLGFVDPKEISELVEHEVSMLQRLDHPGVVRTVEGLIGRMGNRLALFIVQEFIDGDTLEQEVSLGRFSIDDVLDIIAEIAGTLDYLHGLNPPVLHRNIKPANIVRRRADGSLVLIDFGGVRDVLRDLDGRPGAGAEGYASPEQRRGRLDPKADLYGLGVTAVRLLTGLEPEELIDPDTGQLEWQRHAHVGASVQWLLQGLVDADPARRVRNTRELGLRLKTVRSPKRKEKGKRSGLQPLSHGLGGGLQAIPQRAGSLEDAETVLYQGDEQHLGGELSELDMDNETFYGLPGPDGPRGGAARKPSPGRRAVEVDPRAESEAGAPAYQTLVAADSEISEPPPEAPPEPRVPEPARRPPDRESSLLRALGTDSGLDQHPTQGRGADPFTGPIPEQPKVERSLSGRPITPPARGNDRRARDRRPNPAADPFQEPPRRAPPQAEAPVIREHKAPPAPYAEPATEGYPPRGRTPEPHRAPTRPPRDDRRAPPYGPNGGSLPPPMPSVGPTPAELARGRDDIYSQPTAPPPFRGPRPNATLPPPPPTPRSSPTLEPTELGAIDPMLSAPTRPPQPPLKPRPRPTEPEGLVISKGVAMGLAALLVALILLLLIVLVVLLTR